MHTLQVNKIEQYTVANIALYTNIDQKLVKLSHGLLNCEICGLA